MTLFKSKYRIESTRLKPWNYSSRGWYSVTICTHHRQPIFGRIADNKIRLTALGEIADSDLRTLNSHYRNVDVIEHVVMPNHVHAIIMIDGEHCFSPRINASLSGHSSPPFTSPQTGSLSAIVRSYKAGVTFKARGLGFPQAIWQTRFHDHLLRGDRVIAAVRDYILNNPANWAMDKENRS